MIVINPDFVADGRYCWVPVVDRLTAFAQDQIHESHPQQLMRQLLARVLMRDPTIQLQVIIQEHRVVGAVLAMIESDGDRRWVYVLFATMEPGVDVRPDSDEAQKNVERWALSLGLTKVLMASTRSGAAWGRRFGYRESRVVYEKDLTVEGMHGQRQSDDQQHHQHANR